MSEELKVPILKKASVRPGEKLNCVTSQYNYHLSIGSHSAHLGLHYEGATTCDGFWYDSAELDLWRAERLILESMIVP